MDPVRGSELTVNNPVLGQRDLATEQRFGMVSFASGLLTNIRTHTLQDPSREDGGWLVGYEEGGVRKVVDVLWVQSTGRVDVGEFDIFTGEEELPNRLSQLSQNYPGRELRIEGWYHSHSTGDQYVAPFPSGGRAVVNPHGDTNVNDQICNTSRVVGMRGREPLMLIGARRRNAVDLALWRWDKTPGKEAAVYQSGIPYEGEPLGGGITYWQMPHDNREIPYDLPMVDLTEDFGQDKGGGGPDVTITEQDLAPASTSTTPVVDLTGELGTEASSGGSDVSVIDLAEIDQVRIDTLQRMTEKLDPRAQNLLATIIARPELIPACVRIAYGGGDKSLFGQVISPDSLVGLNKIYYQGVKGNDFDVAMMVDMARRVSSEVDQSALERIVNEIKHSPNAPLAKILNKIRQIIGF